MNGFSSRLFFRLIVVFPLLVVSSCEFFILNTGILLQIKWLLKLSEMPQVLEVPRFSKDAKSYLQRLIDGFTMNDALEVKDIERVTNHDVKAVEYFLKQKCQSHPEVAKVGIFSFSC